MSVIHTEPERPLDARLMIFLIGMAAGLLVMFLRLWYLQVVEAESLVERADVFGLTSVPKLAPRGEIVDRNGVLLAGVKQKLVITAVPAVIRKNPQVLPKAAQLLGVPLEKLESKLKDASYKPYVKSSIYVGADIEAATRIAEAGDLMPGLGVESQAMRYYPDTTSLSHLLGYVWTTSERDVKRLATLGRKAPEYVGKIGIEYVYEPFLMGIPGSETIELDAKRRPTRTFAESNPQPGDKLVLSLDLSLQRYALEKLAGRKGAIVMLDPTTGETLCLVSSPTFDTALFAGGISKADWQRLESDPDKPQINRAIYASYAPGSTFKILTTLAGLENGTLGFNDTVFCPGYYKVGTRRFRCLGRHGAVSYERAFARSCNTFFATQGVRAGVDALRTECAKVGLGRRTGIDLLGEGTGIVPTEQWIKKWRPGGEWYPGDTVNFSVGQGEMSATPLQMASLVSLVANEGVSYVPRVVRARLPAMSDGKPIFTQRKQLGRVKLPPATWQRIKQAMAEVLRSGTARASQIPGLEWGGKTGSAENRRNKQTHSWFVGFAPLDKPRVAIAVVVENAGHGSEVAAPIARDMVRYYLRGKTANVEIDARTKELPSEGR